MANTVFGLVLALSAGIGIFYRCVGSKQETNEEFLMGIRQIAPLPVGLSEVLHAFSISAFFLQ